jgi:hypothetical protein
MRQILETEEHVQIPPVVYSDPFYRITTLSKKRFGSTSGSKVKKAASFSGGASSERMDDAHREKYEKFLIDTLSFPDATSPEEPPAEGQSVSAAAKMLVFNCKI